MDSQNKNQSVEAVPEAPRAAFDSEANSGDELPREWPHFDAWRVAVGITRELLPQENTSEKLERSVARDPATGRLLPGSSLNPYGRPPGAENFKTVFEKALKQVAGLNKKDPEQLYIEIISKGITRARNGDFRFFKDLMDRVHGKATEKLDLTSDGQPINTGNQIAFVNFRDNDSNSK